MADIDLAALSAILAKRTPGEWTFTGGLIHESLIGATRGPVKHIASCFNTDDAAAIVAAVNAIGPLLERVRELERESQLCSRISDEAHSAVEQWREQLAAANERIAGLEQQLRDVVTISYQPGNPAPAPPER